MTILHHPSEPLLTAFAAGTLDLGQHIAVATHALSCTRCRQWTRLAEYVGGSVLENMAVTAMSRNALSLVESRLDEPMQETKPAVMSSTSALADVPGLPEFVRHYRAEQWKWIAPYLHVRSMHVPETDDTRVFLLKAGSGVDLLPHTHTGMEMTCILRGSFSHDGTRYGTGDFDLGDAGINHEISIGPEGDCICLVAMKGDLRLKGLLGHLMQPFVSI